MAAPTWTHPIEHRSPGSGITQSADRSVGNGHQQARQRHHNPTRTRQPEHPDPSTGQHHHARTRRTPLTNRGRLIEGGLGAFKSRVPNDTLATDGLLLRVGFMGFHDAMAYMTELERAGMWGQVSGTWVDFVLADQRKGVPDDVAVAWLNTGRMMVEGGSVMAGWLNRTEQGALAVPVAWQSVCRCHATTCS